MSFHFGSSKEKKFSIDDAFEEETDGFEETDHHNNYQNTSGNPTDVIRTYKIGMSRDSDSLIHDGSISEFSTSNNYCCCTHPKVRENWRMVLAAVLLLIIGIGLLVTGTMAVAHPGTELQGLVFVIIGLICFVPGAYHVVFIYLAANGKQGYSFHELPLLS